jgi:predicted Rossmann fold nucleotide-binding protein DprA/Smf involved in DNA uptake
MLKQGGAALVTEPGDALAILESPARHSFSGTHESRYADPSRADAPLFEAPPITPLVPEPKHSKDNGLSTVQRQILEGLQEPQTLDDLARHTGLSPASLRSELTILEIQRRVTRQGSKVAKAVR